MNPGLTSPSSAVHWLDGRPGSPAELGGKGAGLNRLRALGAPVPRAAVIPVSLYWQFARANRIPLHLGEANGISADAVRTSILQAPLPDIVQAAIDRTGSGFQPRHSQGRASVAVRSSATTEDSSDSAFAGLHDSILDVDPATGLEWAVRQCWASLWSDRAVVYRQTMGMQHASLEMAVVIQEMAFSDVSFVAFAADPISGDEDTVLITATWGLCEAVVAGLVVPDEIRVGRNPRDIDYRIGSKHQMVVSAGDGVKTVPVPRVLRSQPAMNPETASSIATTIRILSSGLGFPADVEGGIAQGEVHFFQARPITTLASSPMHPTPAFH